MATTASTPRAALTFKPVHSANPAIRVLNKHDSGHGIFISHLDRHPIKTKMLVFLIPLLFHATLAAIIAFRLLNAELHYSPAASFVSTFIPFVSTSEGSGVGVNGEFMVFAIVNLIFDLYLLTFGLPILKRFVTSHLYMRLRFGFKETEVVFRAPTGSSRLALNELPAEKAQFVFAETLRRAINPVLLRENPGFNTRSDFWVLNYEATMDAYQLQEVEKAQGVGMGMPLEKWDLSVWQKDGSKPNAPWTVFEAHKLNDMKANARALEIMKENLHESGKSKFVDKWLKTMEDNEHADVEKIFKKAGLDLETIWGDAVDEAQRRLVEPI